MKPRVVIGGVSGYRSWELLGPDGRHWFIGGCHHPMKVIVARFPETLARAALHYSRYPVDAKATKQSN